MTELQEAYCSRCGLFGVYPKAEDLKCAGCGCAVYLARPVRDTVVCSVQVLVPYTFRVERDFFSKECCVQGGYATHVLYGNVHIGWVSSVGHTKQLPVEVVAIARQLLFEAYPELEEEARVYRDVVCRK